MERFDPDHKGSLTKKDVPEPVWNRISKADANGDGTVTKDELEAHIKKMREEHQPHEAKPAPADSAKPNSPVEEKPKDPKPDDSKAQTLKIDTDSPADALHPSNVGD